MGWGILSFFFLVSASAGEVEFKLAAIEKQAQVSCAADQEFNQTRVAIAESLIDEAGAAQKLLREARIRSRDAHHAVVNADQMVLKRFEPVWYQATDRAATQVVKNSQQKARAYEAYLRLIKRGRDHFLLNTSEHSPQVKREIASLREQATQDLNYWLGISDRLERAVHKASVCHCQATNMRCWSLEKLSAQTEQFKAIGSLRKSEQDSIGRNTEISSIGK